MAFAWLKSLWAKLWKKSTPAPPSPARVMHWSPDPEGLPMCGATSRALWTLELEHATCQDCRRVGFTLKLQHDLNTR